MKILVGLFFYLFLFISCKQKYETEFEYKVKLPGTDAVISKTSKNHIEATSDHEAKIIFVENYIVYSNIVEGSSTVLSGKLYKNNEILDTNLDSKTIDSINEMSSKMYKNRKFIPYSQVSDSSFVK